MSNLNQALLYHQSGKLEEAEKIYQKVLKKDPKNPSALNLLGLLKKQTGHVDVAIDLVKQAIKYAPTYAEAHGNLGIMLHSIGCADEAIKHCNISIKLKPNIAEFYNNLAIALNGKCQYDESIIASKKAICINPSYADAYNTLGMTLTIQRKLSDAISNYELAITLDPYHAKSHLNLAAALESKGDTDGAFSNLKTAIKLDPSESMAFNNLGNLFKSQANFDSAIICFKKAIEINPTYTGAYNNCLMTLLYSGEYTPSQIFQAHKEFGSALDTQFIILKKEFCKKIKIGYLSADFRNHPVAYFMIPIFENHNKDRFEIYCYSNNPLKDKFTEKIQCQADHWFDCAHLSDEKLTEKIQSDCIDILIDLSGHSANNRLAVFARKAAPIQISYLGYVATTGLSTIDYKLTDSLSDPEGAEQYHTEKLYRLPGALWCYRPLEGMPEINELPALKNGYITFGSFNNFTKISQPVIETWIALLKEIPISKLMVVGVPLGSTTENFKAKFIDQGIDPGRIVLRGKVPHDEFWKLHHSIDIALDPWPWTGGTTTCESLWMGTPVITLIGDSFVSRMSYRILRNIGLKQLCAANTDEYVKIAKWLCDQPLYLATLRNAMRQTMKNSDLMNEQKFISELEDAYLDIHETQ